MRYKVVYASIGSVVLLGIIGGFVGLPYLKQLKGSVSRDAAGLTCNGRDIICVQQGTKIVAQSRREQSECVSDEDCSRLYSMNVSLAVKAIRDYTGIPDLQLTPVGRTVSPFILLTIVAILIDVGLLTIASILSWYLHNVSSHF